MKKTIIYITLLLTFSCSQKQNIQDKNNVINKVEDVKIEEKNKKEEIEEEKVESLKEESEKENVAELVKAIVPDKVEEIGLINTPSVPEKNENKEKKNILRRRYKDILLSINPRLDLSGIDFNNYEIVDENIIFDNKLSLNIEEYKRIFLSNVGIASIYTKNKLKPIVREIDPTKKHIAFTFDDGPLNVNHDKIRELFNEYNQSASFAVVGKVVKNNSKRLIKTYLDGHEIINHSYSHPNLVKKNMNEIILEVLRTDDEIFKNIGIDVVYLRPPYGSYDSRVKNFVGKKNIALWSIDSLDWKTRNVDKIVEEVMPKIKDGSVVLFHDLYEETYEAVKIMLPQLIEEDYQFITYSQLMELKSKKH